MDLRRVFIQAAVFDREPETKDPALDAVSLMCTQSIGRVLGELPDYPDAIPVCFGSAYSVLESLHEFNTVSVKEGPLRVNPSRFPNTVLNAPACQASIRHGLTGPIYNFSNGATSALDALGFAYIQIADEREDASIVCAAEKASGTARAIDFNLTVSSSGALYLSSRPSQTEVLGYSIHVLQEPVRQENGAYGCVEALRLIDTYIKDVSVSGDYELALTQFPYQARVKLRKSKSGDIGTQEGDWNGYQTRDSRVDRRYFTDSIR